MGISTEAICSGRYIHSFQQILFDVVITPNSLKENMIVSQNGYLKKDMLQDKTVNCEKDKLFDLFFLPWIKKHYLTLVLA